MLICNSQTFLGLDILNRHVLNLVSCENQTHLNFDYWKTGEKGESVKWGQTVVILVTEGRII